MLHLTDNLLTLLHLAIILFNLFGWIFPAARKAHFISIVTTAFCWFVLGIWFGWGYCPVTDWQWRIKEQLGETNLPASFITYYADKISGMHFRDSLVDLLTLILFLAATVVSVYLNFFRGKKDKN
jgi:Protein of Unknown function (DUF2784)